MKVKLSHTLKAPAIENEHIMEVFQTGGLKYL